MNDKPEVLFEKREVNAGALGVIILNRPRVLNALSMGMCQAISKNLNAWAEDNAIKAVLIKSAEGRAFCAGGDIRALFTNYEKGDAVEFFKQEYAMNQQIFHYKKPFIALMDGIVMGGGAGISLHGSHPVATERLMFAMPETGIGFFPDVGASDFLVSIPNNIGLYLALTGNIIGAHDLCHFGLVNHVIPSAHLDQLEQALGESKQLDHDSVTAVLEELSHVTGESDITEEFEHCQLAFNESSVERIIKFLHAIGNEWSNNTANMLLGRCPTSLKVTLMLLNRAKSMATFDERIAQDFVVCQHFLQHHDFKEGVRATIIDKDNRPKWNPARLQEVTDAMVQQFF